MRKNHGKRYIAGILGGFSGLLFFRFQFLAVFIPFYIAYLVSINKKVSGPVYFYPGIYYRRANFHGEPFPSALLPVFPTHSARPG